MFATLSTFGPLLDSYGPLMVFMLVPLWIPLGAIVGGAIVDRVQQLRGKVQEPTPVEKLHARRAAERATARPTEAYAA